MAYKRYIEACELAETIENLDIRVAGKSARWYDAKHSVLREIAQSPTADVAEVRHGECVIDRAEHIVPVGRKNSIKHISYKCSECGRKFGNNKYLNYCPNCGAKMDGGKAE